MALVSVILTSYNHEKYIKEAIDSVLNQTFSDFELIILDDCSDDSSWSLIAEYDDSRIKSFRNVTNVGPVLGVNKAIRDTAIGKYIAIHHSDDVWDLSKLQKQVEFLEANEGFGAVFSDVNVVKESGVPLTDPTHFYTNIFSQKNRSRFEWLNFFFSRGNALCHSSVLIRRQCYEQCGLYNELLAQLTDFDMWIRLCAIYEIHIIPEQLVRFRILDSEMNSSGNRPETRIRSATEYCKVIEQYRYLLDADNIIKIFPQSQIYEEVTDVDVEYVFSKICLDAGDFFVNKIVAEKILYDLLSNQLRRDEIAKVYGFTVKDYLSITGKNDNYSVEKLLNLESVLAEQYSLLGRKSAECESQLKSLANIEIERNNLSNNINELITSNSWRVTAPLRYLFARMRIIARLLKLVPQILEKGGGGVSTFHRAARIVRNEGLYGAKIRLKRLLANNSFNSEVGVNSEPEFSIVPYYIDPILDSVAVKCGKDVSIAVHMHLYYTEMLKEFVTYLNNIPFQFNLYVSVPKSANCNAIQAELKARLPRVVNVVVETVPNRGRDIAPMIVQFGKRLAQYEIIAHIHTKKSVHNNNLADWCQAILVSLMGIPGSSGGKVAHIINLLQTNGKVVFPEGRTEFMNERSGWASNHELAKEILEKYTQLSIQDYPHVAFPEGAMFWARAECLKDFLALPLSYKDFPSEPIDADGTLAHALERLILIFASKYQGQCFRVHTGDSIKDYRQYENQQDYSKKIIHSDVKVLSYYLPQFHPTPENDMWHGKGFTEWTKVKSAKPLFEGHYQQHIPHDDTGYYVLDSPETLRKQAEQMRKAGVHGQVFYHYWFSGKQILEEPARLLLDTHDIQMPFCFCWANENWTRRWDGNENEILLGQNYSAQDAKCFIQYLIPFFKDPRHIKIEDRPVLFVYRPFSIPNSEQYLDIWENECAKAGVKRPYVVAVLTRGATNPHDFGMDAGVERVLHDWTGGGAPEIKETLRPYWPINGNVLSYDDVASFYMGQTEEKDFTYFRSTVPTWDNTARYGSEAHILHGSTPQRFQEWMESTISYTKETLPLDRRFVLVNAWNEWAEGAHLEPDSRYGYSYLNSVGRAMSSLPYAGELNLSCPIPVDTKLHLVFTKNILNQLVKDQDLKRRFIHCLTRSTIFNICLVSINAPELMNEMQVSVRSDSIDADYILEFRKIVLFDSWVIEKMLQTTYATGAGVIANCYDMESELIEVTANGSVDVYAASAAPMLVIPTTTPGCRCKNIRMRTDARCFVAKPSLLANSNKPIVTTIIRFHKSADLDELRNALYCLYSMKDCVVIPLIAAQDLTVQQIEMVQNMCNELIWTKGCEPQMHLYQSKEGKGDVRSKMLNESLKQVKTRYAAFLDYDDLLADFSYAWLINRLHKTGKSVAFGRVYSTSYDSARGLLINRTRVYEFGYRYEEFAVNNHAPLHSFMLDLQQLDLSQVVYFEDQRYMEDYLLTLQLFNKDNGDWDSLRENFYIGDYIHSVDREHTLAFADDKERQEMLLNEEFLLCAQRIKDIQKSIDLH